MVKLTNLPGRPGITKAEGVSSRTAAINALRSGNAVTASGDDGAINVYRDNAGEFRCIFCQFRVRIKSETFRHLAAVDEWLREWFPKLGR